MLGVLLQPRCDEPWTEVIYEDSSEGKLTVSASTRAAFTALPEHRCPYTHIVLLCHDANLQLKPSLTHEDAVQDCHPRHSVCMLNGSCRLRSC